MRQTYPAKPGGAMPSAACSAGRAMEALGTSAFFAEMPNDWET